MRILMLMALALASFILIGLGRQHGFGQPERLVLLGQAQEMVKLTVIGVRPGSEWDPEHKRIFLDRYEVLRPIDINE